MRVNEDFVKTLVELGQSYPTYEYLCADFRHLTFVSSLFTSGICQPCRSTLNNIRYSYNVVYVSTK
jgi:hypothetical protein